MSLSNATWKAFSRGANLQETWVARFYYDAAGASDYITLSDRDFMDSTTQVLGVVTDWGDVRRGIDLKEYKAKVDNMSISLANVLYHGAPLSDEFKPGATRKYQNRKVQIYSVLNGNSATMMQIYNGRLMGMSWTADEITLEIEQAQPWDYLKFPSVKADNGSYFPAVYGSFTPNSSTVSSPAYCTSLALWPAKVYEVGETHLRALAHVECATEARAHVYEESVQQFVPLTDSESSYEDTAGEYGEGKMIQAPSEYYLGIKGKALFRDGVDNDFVDTPGGAFDFPREDDTLLTMTTLEIVGNPFSGVVKYLTCDFPFVSAEWYDDKAVTVYFFYDWGTSNVDQTLDLHLEASGSVIGLADSQPASGSGFASVTWSVGASTSMSALAIAATVVSGTVSVTVIDVRITGTARLSTTDKQTKLNTLEKVETLYCGADGLSRSWSTGAVTLIHEFHRDILHRVAGYTTTPENWSALDSARAGWLCRYWLHEPEQVQSILEQAQFEGAFIFMWSMSTTGTGRYLFIEDLYSSSDVAATISELDDTTGIEYSHTAFEDLITKQSISYERHPADDSRHLSTYEFTNTTSRTNWNIQTDENVESIQLDMLVAEVDTWAAIRDNVLGDLKRIINMDIVNPRHFILEIGDIIQVSGDTSRYYMITDERRKPGTLTITALEVYAA